MIQRGMSFVPIMRAGGWKTVHVVARYVENAYLDAINEQILRLKFQGPRGKPRYRFLSGSFRR
jgi:hypothetical protein